MTTRRRTYAVIAGGGTAGHVLPAIAVAEALIDRGHSVDDLHFMGARRGVERRLLPSTMIPHTLLDVSGLQRRLTLSNLWFLPRMIRALWHTDRLFADIRPRVVVSVGGYASLPAVLVARRRKIPVIVASYDRPPGRASRLASRWAAACAVAFEDADLPRTRLTGAPIRRSILAVDRAADRDAARARLGVPNDRLLVVVVGGSLGSAVLNRAVEGLIAGEGASTALAVFHVAGERDTVALPGRLNGADGPWYRRENFVDNVADLYAAADLWLGRGGASTVHEVAASGVPAVLVPWSGAAEDHQRSNVEWLSTRGAARFVADGESEQIVEAVLDLCRDASAREELGQRAHALGDVHRSGAMADLIESVALA
jgi:undecaprenyldiphospho-muramoylpentapeptide beta-N-acetylglucosaminyltransferase